MNPIQEVQQDVEEALPSVWTRLRRPRNPAGMWWLDTKLDAHEVTVQWSPRRGFGVSASAFSDGFGEGPEEVFRERAHAAGRVVELLRSATHTVPPREVVLRELRALVGLTQEELAGRLGVRQAAVSRLERRQDITLSSLQKYVAAMGGELELTVRTAAGELLKLIEPTTASKRAACIHVDDALLARDEEPRNAFEWEARQYLGVIESLARTHLDPATPKFSLSDRCFANLAQTCGSSGVIRVDHGRAEKLARAVVDDPFVHDKPAVADAHRSVLHWLLAHEVGHAVKPTFASSILHPELRADAVAGWLGAETGFDVEMGAAISRAVGCGEKACTHPSPEERSLAYVRGYVASVRAAARCPQLSMLVLRVEDLERSRDFYSMLGLSLKPEQHGSGPLHYSWMNAGNVFELYPCRAASKSEVRLGLRLFDTLKAVSAITTAGFLSKPARIVERDSGPSVCLVHDPDGNVVELELPPGDVPNLRAAVMEAPGAASTSA